MDKFWRLLEQSVIVQGILTIGVTTMVCAMSLKGLAVDEQYWTLLGVAWGFYFGTKSQQQLVAMSKR